ncbi:MAG TPA: enoyl-CoA hydratase/isomerase family protein [Solirubrobacterales bacterium]|jgi:2-(1,2-epoxy-1,2-dihydrophenyl)acetyl-CoA isomerase|nr:enoyl-CoA hydratase/isomerase family protein [Solirubrobacterales bacterium]
MTAPMPPYKQYVREQSASSESLVEVERSGDSAVMRLGDPDKLNVLSAPLMLQLLERTEQLVRDDEVRSIVLTGRGHAFSAGGDLRMMEAVTENLGEPNEEEGAFKPYQWIRYQFGAMVRLIARSDKAFIAAINGPAAGVGLAFALTCDIAVASRDAILVPAFGRLGLVPEVGTSWALTRALGYRRAFEFYVAGEQLDAQRAADLGLVNQVVEPDELEGRAAKWCERLSLLPSHAIPIGKPLLRASADASWEQSLALEEFAEPTCFTTKGFADGVREVIAATAS